MQFEMYVRDRQLGETFEYLFGLFHKYFMIVQHSQTHVVLSKETETETEREICSIFLLQRKALGKQKTDLDRSPPAKVNAPRPVLEGNAPAHRDEAR